MQSSQSIISDESIEKNDSNNKFKYKVEATILGVSGLSAVIAGFVTSHVAKKRNKEFLKELGKEPPPPPLQMVNPYALAFKALAWGTVWAVGSCSLIAFGIWKWFGFKNLEDLRTRMRSKIKKSPSGEGRTEFESIKDFINYLYETTENEKKRGL